MRNEDMMLHPLRVKILHIMQNSVINNNIKQLQHKKLNLIVSQIVRRNATTKIILTQIFKI